MEAVELFFTGVAVGTVFGAMIMALAAAGGRDRNDTE